MLFPSRASFPPPAPANDSAPPFRWKAEPWPGRRVAEPRTRDALLPFALLVLALLATGFRF